MDFSQCDPTVRPLDLVVGGVVAPEDLVGRAAEQRRIQAALTTSEGIVLVGDRRMGKTSLLRRLVSVWRDVGHVVIDVTAQTTDPATFASRLETELASMTWFQSERKRWALNVEVTRLGVTLKRTGGSTNGDAASEDFFSAVANRVAPKQLIVVIDELAVLLAAMNGDGAGSEEFMNRLRSARQTHPNLQIVIAGSIGLHHVIPQTGGLINDLHQVVVGRLTDCEALELALGLLAERYQGNERRRFAEQIVVAAGAIPFYIHWLVQQCEIDADWTEDPRRRLERAMNDPSDPLDFDHYYERLAGYYPGKDVIAASLLDEYALSQQPLSVDEVRAKAESAGMDQIDRPELVRLIGALELDNYLERTPEGHNRFASDVLRAGWIAIRKLE